MARNTATRGGEKHQSNGGRDSARESHDHQIPVGVARGSLEDFEAGAGVRTPPCGESPLPSKSSKTSSRRLEEVDEALQPKETA